MTQANIVCVFGGGVERERERKEEITVVVSWGIFGGVSNSGNCNLSVFSLSVEISIMT